MVSLSASPASALLGPVAAGTSLDLLGSAAGFGPFFFQWERNGAGLAGETGTTLRFADLQLSQNGAAFRLRVANLNGVTTTSAPVVLSVQSLVVNANGIGLSTTNFGFDDSAVVSIGSRFPNATIFYTLDGSPPDFNSRWYVAPFTISTSVVLRAIAYSADWAAWDETGSFYLTRNYYYTLATTSTGGGSVSKNPPGGPYLNFTNVTVTATSSNGWSFLRWEGAASGTNPVVSVYMNTNKTVRGVFGTRLGTTVAGNGSVALDVPDGWYDYGAAARLTGVPGPGSYFGYWGNAAQGSTNPLLFTVRSPSPVVSCIFGTLATNQAALTVLISGNGQVARSPQSNAYSLNQSVVLTATPGSGQKFQGWSGDATGSQTPLTVVMDRSRVVNALFQTNSPTAPPQIVQQPTNRVVVAGSPASFRVVASGTAPLAYQWRRNGAGVAGATSFTYTVAAAQASDAGTYDAVVTNAFGAVTSSVATLSITLPGRISTIRLQPGGGLLLQATGTVGESLLFSTSTNLFDWLPWVLVSNPSGTVQVIDLAPPAPRKFYRAKQP